MTSADIIRGVDRFLETEIEARALTLAFSLGLIDRLAAEKAVRREEFRRAAPMPGPAFDLFLRILAGNGVIRGEDPIRLAPEFREALDHRDLLEAKLWFVNLVAPDVHELFTDLFTDVPRFMAQAKVFELFRYDRCMEATPENLAETARWVGYTSTLTRYEAPACLDRLELSDRRRMLDVGGNSGEFARQACERWPALQATVFDLPVVCELGRRHVSASPAADRIVFEEGDLRHDPLPSGHDLISFKSVLHDWPDEEAGLFMEKATAALEPGGRLVIFERMPLASHSARLTYSMAANLVFMPFFREPDFYARRLETLGMIETSVERMELEMPFFLLTARKKPAERRGRR